jgi:PhzF family phenazine biosynthesis protein
MIPRDGGISAEAVETVVVFADGPGGGNPAPIVLDARGWSDEQMQDLARASGHECAFVVDAAGTGCDLALRFWVPGHEMSMCGHATVGAVWLLHRHPDYRELLPRTRTLRVHTASGVVHARVGDDGSAAVSQPPVIIAPVTDHEDVVAVLGLDPSQLGGPVRNATTSRTKTLVPISAPDVLDQLRPDYDRVAALCDRVGSTGLYPYANTGRRRYDARQFPRSSGYPEDPATGIAAAALAGALVGEGVEAAGGEPIVIRQGRAMGRPSRIDVTFESADGSCWLGGNVTRLRG